MEQYIKNIIPNIKQYGMLLSHKEYFVNKPWKVINTKMDNIEYIFKKEGELMISNNGDVTKCKWELISSSKIIIDTPQGIILFENLFYNKDILLLIKANKDEDLLILINEKVIIDRNPLLYLQELTNNERIYFIQQAITGVVLILIVLFTIFMFMKN